ncbi:MAG: hypothetical protein Fur0041_14670 [Bacteroidia bacterium]
MFSINKPCHELWNAMKPADNGRYCDACCKVVVDFSGKSNDEILGYLRSHSNERVCGRFRIDQVSVPSKVLSKTRKVFLAALYFVFGGLLFTSCSTHTHGEVVGKMAITDTSKVIEHHEQLIMGDTLLLDDTSRKIPEKKQNKKGNSNAKSVNDDVHEVFIKGEVVAPLPQDSVS